MPWELIEESALLPPRRPQMPKKKTAVDEQPDATLEKDAQQTADAVSTDKEQTDGTTKKSNTTESQESEEQEVKLAKAGKRSAKSLKEQEELAEKEARKKQTEAQEASAEDKPKVAYKPARPRIERRAKQYRDAAKLVDKSKKYMLKDALELTQKTSYVKFDATVELHIRLNVDPRQADQNIRDSLVLPAGSGKTVRVAVFADVDDVAKAKKAGADVAASEEFLQQLDKGTIDFDVLISTPAMMPKLGKYARVLGPKGLMPNPKSGTVTTDVAKAVSEAKAGKIEYRVDEKGIVHVGFGKVSFGTDKLMQNAQAVFASIKSNKPSGIKGGYVKSVYLPQPWAPASPLTQAQCS
jgi:ribosomal protein L1